MPEPLTRESYLQLVQKSGLVEKPRLQAFLAELRRQGRRPKEPDELADELVAAALLTPWQARTLLKGRYKGFHLGKYKLLDLLGTGGMGSVYLAEHVLMRRKVAIKVLPPKRVGRKAYLQRFYREARAVAQLDHPNIVRAYDVDQDGDVHFLVMEYVDGTSLFRLIKQDGPLSPHRAGAYVRQACEGLGHAFEAGLVHRDIKPGNLLIDRRETVKLADLGLARFFSEEDDEPLTTHQKESVLGTVDYLAPEQALDSHAVDIRADIYSLGCTLYFLLTGRPPFAEGTMAQRLMYHQTREPEPLQTLRPDVPASLVAIVEKMMAKQPQRRYQTPAELNLELDRWLAQQPAAPHPGGPRGGTGQTETGSSDSESGATLPMHSDDAAAYRDAVPAPQPAPRATVEPTAPADAAADTELDRFLAQLESDSTAPEQAASADTSSEESHVPVGAAPPEPAPRSAVRDGFAPPERSPGGHPQSADARGRREHEAAQPAPSLVAPNPEPARDEFVFEPSDETPDPVRRPDSAAPASAVELRLRDPRNKYFVAAAVVILLATVLVMLSPLIFSGKRRGGKPSGETGTGTGASRGARRGLTPRGPRAAPKRPLVWVKPFGGDFTSIAAALAAAEAGQVIRVAGGATFRTRIELDANAFPADVQLEVEPGRRATLQAPDGAGPLVQLRDVKGFRMRGFDLEAAGQDVAVHLEGKLAGTRLSDLSIRGFARSGVLMYACRGELHGRVFLGRVEFQAAQGTGAAGIVLSGGADDEDSAAGHVQIQQCRFDASLAQGIRFEAAADNVEVSRCVLGARGEGIVFEDVSAAWRSIAIANNTFDGMHRGIVFRRMPPEGSRDLSMRNNLFYNLDGPAGEVEQGYDDPHMVGSVLATHPSGASHNWDNRPAQETKEPTGALPLFGIGGRREPFDAEVVSTEPSDPDFLRPRAKGRLATGGAGGELPVYVGALAPAE